MRRGLNSLNSDSEGSRINKILIFDIVEMDNLNKLSVENQILCQSRKDDDKSKGIDVNRQDLLLKKLLLQ